MNENIFTTESANNTETVTTNSVPDYAGLHYLINSGFINIGIIGDLLQNGLPFISELNCSGCYAMVKPENYTPGFILPEVIAATGNVINPWSVDRLKSKWVEDADIVYFGIAGIRSNRSLRKRLTDLINHGNGRTTDRGPHKGGEIFWQLKGYERFTVWILAVTNPRQEELGYLVNFYNSKGKLPFANRQL